MRTATAARHEPEERDTASAYDGMLRLFEHAVETCKAHDLEPQMRTILARTLPNAEPERTAGVNFALSMGTVLKALQDANPRNYSEGQRQTLSLAKQIVVKSMSAALVREAA